MSYLTYRNRGEMVEELILKTTEYYRANKIAYFRKTNPDFSHMSYKKQSLFEGTFRPSFRVKLVSKGDLDFYGVYSSKYFSVELKETKEENFKFSLIKKHQWEQMEEINNCGGYALLLIHFFHSQSSFWIVTYSQLTQLKIINKIKKFGIKELKKINAYETEIIYPGILDLKKVFNDILKNKTNF